MIFHFLVVRKYVQIESSKSQDLTIVKYIRGLSKDYHLASSPATLEMPSADSVARIHLVPDDRGKWQYMAIFETELSLVILFKNFFLQTCKKKKDSLYVQLQLQSIFAKFVMIFLLYLFTFLVVKEIYSYLKFYITRDLTIVNCKGSFTEITNWRHQLLKRYHQPTLLPEYM